MNVSFNAGQTVTIYCHLHHVIIPGTELYTFGKALRVQTLCRVPLLAAQPC